MSAHLKSRSTILLYRDLLRIARKIQPEREAQDNIITLVRTQFKANAGEKDYNKVQEHRADAIRAITSYYEILATQTPADNNPFL